MKQALGMVLLAVLAFCLLGLVRRDPPARKGGREIEFWTYSGGGSAGRTVTFWGEVAASFEQANPGVHVRMVADINQGNFLQMLTTRFLGGNPPDVFIVDDNMAVYLNQDKLLRRLNEFAAADPAYRTEDFPPSMTRDGYVGDGRFSIPWYGGYGCLVYRKDLFEQAGVKPPETWDELVQVCLTLKEKLGMEYPFATQVQSSFWMFTWMWQAGADILSADHRTVTINSPEMVGALEYVRDLVYRHKVVDPGIVKGKNITEIWAGGQAAIVMDGGWMLGKYDDNYPQWKGKWGVSPLPAGKHRYSFYGGQHLAMAARTKQPDLAWKFMVHATLPYQQKRWTDITGAPPANLRTLEMPEFKQAHPEFAGLDAIIMSGRNNPLTPLLFDVWYGRFQNMVMDRVMPDPRVDVAAALREVSAEMQRLVDAYWAVHPHFVQGRPAL